MRALAAFGADHVDYLVPNRFVHGYGLTPELVELASARNPDLIVTVDNGVASVTGIRAARERGISTLITDHHLPGDELPQADAMVNPNQPDCPFPCKSLAGVGVIFYVLSALRAHLRSRGWFHKVSRPEPNLARWLDLVALGTVADLVPLDRNNRILVAQGLARIRAARCVPGISALVQVAAREHHRLCSRDIAFALAPRLNAAGRLEDMALGIECLVTDDPSRAAALAEELDGINRERRGIEADMQITADQALSRWSRGTDPVPAGLCLYDPDWHQGVIGILAARVRQRVHRPVIVFAPGAEDELKGSARSIPELHIRDLLAAVDVAHPGLIRRFGGHAMAAGLSLQADRLPVFSRLFAQQVSRELGAEALTGVVYSDGPLAGEEMSLATADLLQAAGPWGQGFPEPQFDGEFEVVHSRVLRDRHLRLCLHLAGDREELEAIAFNAPAALLERVPARLRIVYRLEVNEFRGRRRLQLVIEHCEPA
jgi:single-stranded-DNA-specific exonuclease